MVKSQSGDLRRDSLVEKSSAFKGEVVDSIELLLTGIPPSLLLYMCSEGFFFFFFEEFNSKMRCPPKKITQLMEIWL